MDSNKNKGMLNTSGMSENDNTETTMTPNTKTSRRNPRRNNDLSNIGSEMKTFAGEKPDLEGVLGLMMKRLDHRVTFDCFQDKLKNYIFKFFTKAEDVVGLIIDLKEPKEGFEAKQTPADPENKGSVTEL